MITGPLRSRIDKLWEEFWTGGITNPLTVIEQISCLMFSRLLDMRESTEEKRWNRAKMGKAFPGYRFTSTEAGQKIRWSNFRHLSGEAMLPLVRDKVFPHFRTLGTNGHQPKDEPKNTFAEYMKDAQLMIQKPSLLVSAVNMIEELPLAQGDNKGGSLRIPAQQADHSGHQRPVPHAPAIFSLMVDLMERLRHNRSKVRDLGDPLVVQLLAGRAFDADVGAKLDLSSAPTQLGDNYLASTHALVGIRDLALFCTQKL